MKIENTPVNKTSKRILKEKDLKESINIIFRQLAKMITKQRASALEGSFGTEKRALSPESN